MHRTGAFVAFTCLALSGFARAEVEAVPLAKDAVVTPAGHGPETAGAARVAPDGKIQVGAAFLSMLHGRANATYDMPFVYGVAPSLSYLIVRGLSVGVVGQILFNVKHQAADALKQYDVMARVAYAFPIVSKIAIYGEGLAGYSTLSPPKGDSATGWVLAVGAGALLNIADRGFVNLGAGYQWGLQSISVDDTTHGDNTQFVRLVLGGGVRL